jgi:mono/diheme cytochrome c family protein
MRQFTLAAVFLTLVLSGCKQTDVPAKAAQDGAHIHGTPKDWKFTLPAGNAADGRKLFVEAECHKCHEVQGEKFPDIAKQKGDVGPELSQMAGLHPAEFFFESIVNPNAVIDHDAKEKGYVGDDGKSKMPSYNDTLTMRQLADLTAYLTSLKGTGGHKH